MANMKAPKVNSDAKEDKKLISYMLKKENKSEKAKTKKVKRPKK